MSTPLKLNGTDGDVKFFSTSEENYISYQIWDYYSVVGNRKHNKKPLK